MLSRPHPCLGWLHVTPTDTRKVMARLLQERDAALELDPSFSGMPQTFIDWTWQTWLPNHMYRYEKQIADHIAYLDLKIDGLNKDLEHIAPTPTLDVVDDWPRSTTRTEWFRLTSDLIQSVIADKDLDPDSLSQVEEAFISAGVL